MSLPLLGIEGQSECNVSLMASSVTTDCISRSGSGLKECNFMGLSDCSSVDSSVFPNGFEENRKNLNLKATELRLCLPGSELPERDSEFILSGIGIPDEKQLFPLVPSKEEVCLLSQKTVISGNKREFSNTVDGFPESKSFTFNEGNWIFNASSSDSGKDKSVNDGINVMLSNRSSGSQPSIKTEVPAKTPQECNDKMIGANTNSLPAAKAQIVGWPPIRSYRKNNLATNSKNSNEVDGKSGPGALFVKVSMDGAPYLRKVDLRMYASYRELSTALEKMFSCFTFGQYGLQGGAPSKETLSESKLRDLLHGSDYVLTYEDKDSDWMLVGDVPWKMFMESCKRLKIMKGSDAIGLAPRAVEKSKSRN